MRETTHATFDADIIAQKLRDEASIHFSRTCDLLRAAKLIDGKDEITLGDLIPAQSTPVAKTEPTVTATETKLKPETTTKARQAQCWTPERRKRHSELMKAKAEAKKARRESKSTLPAEANGNPHWKGPVVSQRAGATMVEKLANNPF